MNKVRARRFLVIFELGKYLVEMLRFALTYEE